jgi:hypothetical protein
VSTGHWLIALLLVAAASYLAGWITKARAIKGLKGAVEKL